MAEPKHGEWRKTNSLEAPNMTHYDHGGTTFNWTSAAEEFRTSAELLIVEARTLQYADDVRRAIMVARGVNAALKDFIDEAGQLLALGYPGSGMEEVKRKKPSEKPEESDGGRGLPDGEDM